MGCPRDKPKGQGSALAWDGKKVTSFETHAAEYLQYATGRDCYLETLVLRPLG